ncbi:MAG: bifunctional (p)ppGpp synthetase/guanosine-3',5'-bis(diphosphate) 3'-pyrophosphohydrolase [Bacteroidota bacterium]|nr:bifunctional (p)ppGpp synthetase/guanosine-3',5'-bis(diphosphate) 3'-pyrophosphohydrolase [Bacteroidota bacterium]
MKAIDIKQENKDILNKYRSLLRACQDKTNKKDRKNIRKAFNLALDAHKEMRRKSGEPYIFHPIAVAHIAAKEIGLGKISIISALLHDVIEDTEYQLKDIEEIFGKKVAKIIDGLTKIGDVFDQNVSLQAENFRKMLLTLSDDVRVILIKLADRLHNMRTLKVMPKQKQLKIASETLYLYAPLAHRLGLYSMKTELEDLGLKYTKPEIYKAISLKLNESKNERNRFINKFAVPIKEALKAENLKFNIQGRPKSIFSIRNKIKNKGVRYDDIYDKFAIRIIVESTMEKEKSDCWKIYSIVTDFYKPNPDRLRDWISTPKTNGYESLHTTVMGEKGKWVEVQIRSQRMDEIAEKGYAAHWRYKQSGGEKESSLDNWIQKIRELLENPESNAIDFIDDFKLNLFSGEIYIFTPAGDLKTLPKGATCLDFAFDIHTEIGLKCMGSKVNGKLVPLSHILTSGDQVEIITSKKQTPRKDWLRFVVTSRAKSKIKASLKEEKRQIAIIGKETIERKLKHLKIKLSNNTETQLIKFFETGSSQELYYRIGIGAIGNTEIKKFVKLKNSGWYQAIKNKFYGPPTLKKDKIEDGKIIVFGENDEVLNYKLAKCCNPIAGDDIFGFLTVVDGIKIHRSDCPNAIRLRSNYAYRFLKAEWVNKDEIDFIATISLTGIDNIGIMNKVTQIISKQMSVNIKSINISTNDGVFEGEITLKVHNVQFLNSLTKKLQKIESISSITRTYKHN